MDLIGWFNSKAGKCDWLDIAFIKLTVAAFVLMLAKVWEPVLSLDWYWYAAAGALAAIKPTYLVFKK
jgi:hypothetical protein